MKRFGRAVSGLLTPHLQVRLAWFALVVSLIGWPASVVATLLGYLHEPPLVLSLSWWAILATALGHLSSAQANEQVSKESD